MREVTVDEARTEEAGRARREQPERRSTMIATAAHKYVEKRARRSKRKKEQMLCKKAYDFREKQGKVRNSWGK